MDKQIELLSRDQLPIVAEQKKTLKMEGQILKRPGQVTFEFNYVLKTMTIAEHKETTAILNEKGETVIHHKTSAKPNCVYFQTLNEINAWKRAYQIGALTDQEYLSNVMRIKTSRKKKK